MPKRKGKKHMLNPNSAGAPAQIFRAIDRIAAEASALRQIQARLDQELKALEELRPLLVRRGPKPILGR
jgi:hypothetical protein